MTFFLPTYLQLIICFSAYGFPSRFYSQIFSFGVLPRTLDLVGITPQQGMSKDLWETWE